MIRKSDLEDVLHTLTTGGDTVPARQTQRFLAVQKLMALIDGWEEPAPELDRLQRFERDARAVLGAPYEIRPATWKNPDGSEHMLRILDEVAVLKLLKDNGGLKP